MHYSIGYRLPDGIDSTVSLCRDYGEHISNVYFSFADEPSGRLPLCTKDEAEEVGKAQLEELKEIKRMGKTLTLLLNAACYGEGAVSPSLAEHVTALCKRLKEETDLDRVTTASPFIADTVKRYFGDALCVMASVNMRVGTVRAMEQLSQGFDGFYAAKECNRDLSRLKELLAWCEKKGKRLSLLANSGCLPYCAYQGFHDNLVAHETPDCAQKSDWDGLPSPCHRFLSSMGEEDALAYFLGGTWIRPEDIGIYEPLFREIKLATRMHARARSLVAAYARGRFAGNLLDLTEPSFSRDFRGTVLDGTRLPADFFSRVTACGGDCKSCGYCKEAARGAVLRFA